MSGIWPRRPWLRTRWAVAAPLAPPLKPFFALNLRRGTGKHEGSPVGRRGSSYQFKHHLPCSVVQVLLERQETSSKASMTDLAAGRDWEAEQFASS